MTTDDFYYETSIADDPAEEADKDVSLAQIATDLLKDSSSENNSLYLTPV